MPRPRRLRISGILAGAAATLLVAAYTFGVRRAPVPELQLLDWRFLHCNDLRPDPRLVHVDIDDAAVDRVGRWPWPRREIADLIRAMHELGAAMVVVDLLFDDPQGARLVDPRQNPFADIEGEVRVFDDLHFDRLIDDDLELSLALRDAGNVILSVHAELVGVGRPDPLEFAFAALRSAEPAVTVDQAILRLGLPSDRATRRRLEREWIRHRVADVLDREFTLDETAVAARIGAPVDDVRPVLAGVKTAVARRRVRRLLAERPDAEPGEIRAAILGDAAEHHNADRVDVLAATVRARSEAAALARWPPAPAGAGERLARAPAIDPPHKPFSDACLDMGAVNFASDSDGLVRRIPLLLVHQGRLIKHLGFAAACRALGVPDDRIELRDGAVRVRPPEAAAFDIPIDSGGQMLIHWTRDAARWRHEADIPHVSVAKLWTLVSNRRQIEDNEQQAFVKRGYVVHLATGGRDPEFEQLVHRLYALREEARRARAAGPEGEALSAAKSSEEADVAARIERRVQSAARMVDRLLRTAPMRMTPIEMAADPAFQAALAARSIVSVDLPRLSEANEALHAANDRLLADLSPHIRGKFVFLGYAATATGDIVPTPIDPITNGVMCHAYVFNTILHRAFVRTAPAWAELAAILLLGAAVTVWTASHGPWTSLVFTGGITAAYGALNAYGLFLGRSVWMIAFAPAVAVSLSWAAVTVYRQLTAERERRIFAQQLGQYTAPAIAARIAESDEAVAAFKNVQSREVTCLFTDLQGFTTISEQESAETIQHVLNTYLERMSRVIWARRGLINKFIGDGIMCFFNGSVDPLPDHPRAACDTALDLLAELENLKSEQRDAPDAGVFRQLRMRVGVATGVCKNGDFGSELKADYTVIGDVVNLAARLEPANKVFGTSILVSQAVRDAAGDDFEFRYIAELQVKGKARTVPVCELICRRGELGEAERALIQGFEAGVRLYQERRWDACIAHFSRLLADRPGDAGAIRYIDACREFKENPPDDQWRGALELKEK